MRTLACAGSTTTSAPSSSADSYRPATPAPSHAFASAVRVWAKLKALKAELRHRLHHPIPDVGKWLEKVVSGYYRYHAVPGNARILWAFRFHVGRLWWRTLKRRSQRSRWNWVRMTRLIDRWLPCPGILHPYREQRLRVTTRGRSPVR